MDLGTYDLLQVRGMEFKQRAAVKIWLGSFQCTSASITGHNGSSGCKNTYYCPAQEPDFQVRAPQASFRKALQNGVGGEKQMASQRGNNSQFREESYEYK